MADRRNPHPSRFIISAALAFAMVAILTFTANTRDASALATITVSGTVTLNGVPAPVGTVVDFGPVRNTCPIIAGAPTTQAGQYSVTMQCFTTGLQFATADAFIDGDLTSTSVCLEAGHNLTGVNVSYPSGGSAAAGCVPTISNISPNSGPAAGGTSVTITGTYFANGTLIGEKAQVLIDGVQVNAANVAVSSHTQIVFTTPAHIDDIVDIRVQNPGNQFIEKADAPNGFTFGAPSGGTVQFASVAYNGSEAGPLSVNLAVSRTGGSVGSASATCAVIAGGVATTPADFTLTTATVNWADGDTATKNCVVLIVNDSVVEGTESANFQLNGPTGSAALGAQTNATLSIADDDFAGAGGTIQYQSATYNASESTALLNVAVTRTGGTTGTATATCSVVAGGSATPTADFATSFVNLTWFTGDSSVKNCGFVIANDSLIEGPETFNLGLTVGGSGTAGPQATAVVTIVDNDSGGTIQFGAAAYAGTEAGAAIQVQLTRTGGATGAASATCHVEPTGTAVTPADFTIGAATVNWSANDATAKFCTITIVNDTAVEPDETIDLSVTVGGTAALGVQATTTVTIHDNDAAGAGGSVQFSSLTYTVTEGTATVNIGITRTGGSTGAASATCSVATGGTASTPADFSLSAGTVNWANGDSATKNCVVSIVNDTAFEAAETVNLSLGGSPGAATFGAQVAAVLTINDNDVAGPGGTVQFGAATYTVAEGVATVTISVTRIGGSTGTASATCSVAVGGTAQSPADFTLSTGSVSWLAGDAAAKNCIVTVVDDQAVEGAETVNLALSGPTASAALGAQVTSTLSITDNDVAVGGIDVSQGATGALWTGSMLTAQANANPFSRGFDIELPSVVNAVFQWSNTNQSFEFWFRGFPLGFSTLVDLHPGEFYFFQSSAQATVAVPNPTSYTVPGPGGNFTMSVTGAISKVWSGNVVLETGIAAAMPVGVSAIFHWNDAGQSFDFWFLGFPTSFDTLDAGLEHGKHYFFQGNAGTVVQMP